MVGNLLRKMFLFAFMVALVPIVMAQTGRIEGTVTDIQTQETLPGANVFFEGTTTGVSTDLDGKFRLDYVEPGDYTVVVSFVGYKSEAKNVTVTAGETVTLNFEILEDQMMLDELVVVGYGTKRKREINSSISKVKVEEIQDIPVPTFETALQGRAPGVQITQDNGMASSSVTIRIRGTSSVQSSSQPLYVIDGVPIVTGSFTTSSGYPDKSNVLSLINPNDIESIEILKDASAAAIYGARSANGVVLITTKQGKAGKTKFDAGYYYGVSDVTNKLDVLDGPDYLKFTKEAWTNSYLRAVKAEDEVGISRFDTANNYEKYWGSLAVSKEIAESTNTDWIDEMLRKGKVHSVYLNANGGNDKTKFFVGGTYDKTEGILVDNDFERLTGKVKVDNTASDWLSVGMNMGLTYGQYKQVPTGWAGGLGTAQSRSLPIVPIYDSTGSYFLPRAGTNTVAQLESIDYNSYQFLLIGGAYAKVNFTKDLFLRADFGLNNFFQRETMYESTITRENARGEDRRVQFGNYTTNTTLNYSKSLNEIHNINAMVGMSVQSFRQYEAGFWGEDFPSPELKNPHTATKRDGYGFETGYGFLSYFTRISYNFNNRYWAEVSLRRDGSSRFGDDKKYGVFPAASVGWTITDEDFMKNIPVLTYFKLRASYGRTGNAEIGNFSYLGRWEAKTYNSEGGIAPKNLGNPNLHWEVATQTDIGFDFGLLEGRISGGFDYYYKLSSELLLNKNIHQTSGFPNIIDNIGELYNKGVELFISSNNLTGEFKWTTDFNFSYNKNEILDLGGQEIEGPDAGGTFGNNIAVEGHPIGAWRLVEYHGVASNDGFYTVTNGDYDPNLTNPELFDPYNPSSHQYGPESFEVEALGGDPLFINAFGEVTPIWDYDQDAKIIGNPYPKFFGGFSNTFSYKGFDLNIFFTYSFGNDVYRDDGKFFEGGNLGSNWNQMQVIEDRWQKPGDVTDQPILLWNSSLSTYNMTKYLDDASFVRLKTLTLGYNFPSAVTQKMKLDRLRIYVMGTNILTFTDYPGWDPEVNRDNSANVTQGVTYLSPPQAKTWTFGINIGF